MSSNERRKELKRRRHRREKLQQMKRRLEKASVSEKSHIAAKIRRLTPGGEQVLENFGLEER